jgi:hypothetical protein
MGGQNCTPITPGWGSIFHADSQVDDPVAAFTLMPMTFFSMLTTTVDAVRPKAPAALAAAGEPVQKPTTAEDNAEIDACVSVPPVALVEA